MAILVLGLILLLGVHVLATFPGTKAALHGRFGEQGYKLGFTIVAAAGLALIVWGFSRYRAQGMIEIWDPPVWTRHIAILLMWFAVVSLAAMNRAPGRIRGWLRHPMLNAVKFWATAHLLANGDLGGMILFGSFLAFAVYDRIAVKRRGDLGAPRIGAFARGDAITLGVGTAAYLVMIFLHPYIIGVAVIA